MSKVVDFNEYKHRRDPAGRFAPKDKAEVAEVTVDDVKAASTPPVDHSNDDAPDEYLWGVPDWVDRPSPDHSPTISFCPTERQALATALKVNGEFVSITYAEPDTAERDALGRLIPGTGTLRMARGRCTKDDSGRIVVYGEPARSPGGGFKYGANEYIRIPARDVLCIDVDQPVLAVGSLDQDATPMQPTGDPMRPAAYYDEAAATLHVRTADGAVVSYWPVPEEHGDHLVTNPAAAHGRYQVTTVFAPDRRRVSLAGGMTATYRLHDRTLTVHDATGDRVLENVQPSSYALAFATRNPAESLRSLISV